MLVLLLTLGCIVLGLLVVILPRYQSSRTSALTSLAPRGSMLMRMPPPCHAPNPVETPCTSSDPLAVFPAAMLTVPTAGAAVEVAVVDGDKVYAVGKAVTSPGNSIVTVPLSVADPIPIRATTLQVEYVARIIPTSGQTEDLRWPLQVHVVSDDPTIKPSPTTTTSNNTRWQDGDEDGENGLLYHWAVSEPDRQPLITSTFITPQGHCVQHADEGAQFVVPIAGMLDRFTVYCPPQFRNYPLHARLVINNNNNTDNNNCNEGQGTLDCWHALTADVARLKLQAGDRFALHLSNAAGDYGYVTASVRFREIKNFP